MKDILFLMARYNRDTNVQLFDLLETVPPDMLRHETGSYFGDILGLLNHILVSDLAWLAAFRDGSLDLPALKSPVLEFTHPGWNTKLYHDFAELRRHRESLDSLIVEFVEETEAELFEESITVTRSGGKSHVFPFGLILMHLFNHQTHHRGAISQILDENEVENDYSNLMRLLLG